MLSRLAVSRPTFRQAVKMVALEQLLTTRRGLHGGLYATRPDPSAVVHVAAIYLNTREATQAHLIRAYPPSFVEAARIAALSTDNAMRRRLAAFLRQEPDVATLTVREFFLSDREFTQLLFEMTGNPVLQLIAAIIYDFSTTFLGRGIFTDRPERARAYVRVRRKLTEAILDREEQVAVVYALQCQDEVKAWLEEDEAAGLPSSNVKAAARRKGGATRDSSGARGRRHEPDVQR